MLELLRYNPVNVVAAIDYRNNGSLNTAGIGKITNNVYAVGKEQSYPLLSIVYNVFYYKQLAKLLDQLMSDYADCKFIISANYTPVMRFVINHVGAHRIELWEDGLNHYLRLESLSITYYLKEIVKLSAGFYPRGAFNNNYRTQELSIHDRFVKANLNYPRPSVVGDSQYYIGQPLIEDNLITESMYRDKLKAYFADKKVIYLPHPRETQRDWWDEIFTVVRPRSSAEQYISNNGAGAIYSAFSTVNVNIQCDKNIFLANYLGLNAIANKLAAANFEVELV